MPDKTKSKFWFGFNTMDLLAYNKNILKWTNNYPLEDLVAQEIIACKITTNYMSFSKSPLKALSNCARW